MQDNINKVQLLCKLNSWRNIGTFNITDQSFISACKFRGIPCEEISSENEKSYDLVVGFYPADECSVRNITDGVVNAIARSRSGLLLFLESKSEMSSNNIIRFLMDMTEPRFHIKIAEVDNKRKNILIAASCDL